VLKFFLSKSGYFQFSDAGATFVTLENFGSNLKIFIQCFLSLFNAFFFGDPILSFKVILHLMNFLVVCIGIYGLFLLFKKELTKNKAIGIFIPLAFLLTILAFIFSNKPSGLPTTRYLIILPFLLSFGVFTFIAKIADKKKIYLMIFFLLAGLLILLNILSLRYIYRYQPPDNIYKGNYELISILKAEGLEYGYTDYWKAGINTFLSGNKIKIRQIYCNWNNGKIEPYFWIASDQFFWPESFRGKTFLLLDSSLTTCSREKIIEQFGLPKKERVVGIEGQELDLFIFNYNIARQF
jgi:hypothetical protein